MDYQEKLREDLAHGLKKSGVPSVESLMARIAENGREIIRACIVLENIKDMEDDSATKSLVPVYKDIFESAQNCSMGGSMLKALALELYLNNSFFEESGLGDVVRSRSDSDSYSIKQSVVKSLNEKLREYRMAIASKEHDPSILYAIASKDGAGRYTLENRKTKKRAGAYKSITELMPFILTTDLARKEGVIERRKKKSDT